MQALETISYMNRSMSQRVVPYALLAVAALSAACGGEKKATPSETPSTTAAPAAAVPSGPLTPDPGGKIITVELISDAAGNYFKPSEITAKRGDVVRYTLKVGVHNVHFLADSNAGRTGYPQAPSDFLQLPGQTYDVAVHMAAGTYYFQCDPHVALGMKGHLIVQ
jgi:plastocyanin